MADAGATDISTDAPAAISQTPQDPPTATSITRKNRSTGFVKPDSPRKRRRPGEDSSPISSTPPISDNITTPISPKYSVSPPTLTAAQALLDQRKQKQLQEAVFDRQTSSNSAKTALVALQGKQMVSPKESENAVEIVNSATEPVSAVAQAIQQPQVPHVGVAQMQQNVTSSSSFGPVEETTAASMMDTNGGPVASPGRMDEHTGNEEDPQTHSDTQRPRRQETDPGESRSDKAFTYPGPLPKFPQADRRRNTHSGFGRDSESKSPSSTKKHQCEFPCTP